MLAAMVIPRPARNGLGLGASALALAGTSVMAQTSPATAPMIASAIAPATADAASNRTFSVVPSLSIGETLTDNSGLVSTGRQADLVTQITPGIRITSNGGRVKGFLDYSLTGLIYARNSGSNQIQNALNALVSVEAIESRAFIDASANISQQSISAFGTQSADSTSINNNRTEVRSYTLSPYLRGDLSSFANYEARLTHSASRNSSDSAADNSTDSGSLHLGGDSAGRPLSWAADGTRQVIRYTEGTSFTDDRLRAQVFYAVDPALRLSVIEGREANNFLTGNREFHNTPGLGLDWRPTERTRVSAEREQRFFGNSHSYVFEHRMPSSVWRYSDTEDVATGFNQPTAGSQGTAFDLLFTQFASQQPDPVLRAKLVSDFLQANGISPTTRLVTGSLASAPTVQRTQELSFAWTGLRDTLTVGATKSEARRLDTVAAVTDDFSNGNLVRARGASIGLAHRLTPLSALNLNLSIVRTTGNSDADATTLRSVVLAWNGRFGPRINSVIGARHTVFDSVIQPYTESAVFGTFGYQF